MQSTLMPVIVDAGATLLAAAIGFAAITIQIARQGRLNRESISETERRRIKAEMFAEIEALSEKVSETCADFTTKLTLSVQELMLVAHRNFSKQGYPQPTSRIVELNNLHHSLQSAVSALVMLLERRQFVTPAILVFRSAFHSATHPVSEKFNRQFFPAAMRALPTDLPDGSGIFDYEPPSISQAQELYDLAMAIVDDLHSIPAFILDLMVEMQKFLLSDLFDTEIPPRSPLDPSKVVVSLEESKALEAYFLSHTEWGMWLKTEEEKFRMNLSQRQAEAAKD